MVMVGFAGGGDERGEIGGGGVAGVMEAVGGWDGVGDGKEG